MVSVRYTSGEDAKSGDVVRYHGELGRVEFVVFDRIGDPARDWYLDEHGPGLMITAEHFGRVFLAGDDIDDTIEFVERAERRE